MALLTMTRAAESEAKQSPAERLLAEKRPLVIAHRGYSSIAPENTIPAFEFAKKAGADLVELDYYHSKDGIPVTFHDGYLDRTSDADERWNEQKIRPDSKTAAEMQSLDAGKWFSPLYEGTGIPLLTESLDVIQKGGVTLIERKAGDAATCIRILKEKDLINEVVVQAFDWNYLSDFHKQEPQQVLGALGPPGTYEGKKLSDAEKALSPKWNQIVKDLGARVVVWNRNISKEAVDDAHKKGLNVWVYTINEVEAAQQLLDLGIDGIITDNTSLIWRAMALR